AARRPGAYDRYHDGATAGLERHTKGIRRRRARLRNRRGRVGAPVSRLATAAGGEGDDRRTQAEMTMSLIHGRKYLGLSPFWPPKHSRLHRKRVPIRQGTTTAPFSGVML